MASTINGTIDSNIIFSATDPVLLQQPIVVSGSVTFEQPYSSAATVANDFFKITVNDIGYHYDDSVKKWVIDDGQKAPEVHYQDSVTVVYSFSDTAKTAFSGFPDELTQTLIVGENFDINPTLNLVLRTYTITVTQTSHQTISVIDKTAAGQNTYTSSFTAKYGDELEYSISSVDEHYIAGEISVTGYEDGFVNQAVSITATEAVPETRTVTIQPTTNQTITVNFSNGHTYTSSTTDNVVCTEPYGVTFTVDVTPGTGYIAGAVHVVEATKTETLKMKGE